MAWAIVTVNCWNNGIHLMDLESFEDADFLYCANIIHHCGYCGTRMYHLTTLVVYKNEEKFYSFSPK